MRRLKNLSENMVQTDANTYLIEVNHFVAKEKIKEEDFLFLTS